MAKKDKKENQELNEKLVPAAAEAKTGLIKTQQGQYEYLIKRKNVRVQTRRRTMILILIIFILISILVTGAIYGILSFIEFNTFRISVDKSGTTFLSLSETYDFTNPTNMLSVKGPKEMDNIAYEMLPIDEFLASEGSHNGDSYIATSFFLMNSGSEALEYAESISLSHTYRDLDAAVRILVIKTLYVESTEGGYEAGLPEFRVYARANAEGEPEYVSGGDHVIPDYAKNPNLGEDFGTDWLTIPFLSETSVVENYYYPMVAGEKIRYSIAVWLEGTDPDCVDSILGGKVTLDIKFVTRSA